MIKTIFLLGTICTALLVNAAWPDTFNWNSEDVTLINSWVESTKNNNDLSRLAIAYTLKELAGKTTKTITYDEFKTIINNNISLAYDKNTKKISEYKLINTPIIAKNVTRFNEFIPTIIRDTEFNNSLYVAIHFLNSNNKIYNLTATEWRKILFDDKIILNFQNNIKFLDLTIKKYEKEQLNFSKEQVKSDMELLKRLIYPQLNKNGNLKPIAVKTELILRSVQ